MKGVSDAKRGAGTAAVTVAAKAGRAVGGPIFWGTGHLMTSAEFARHAISFGLIALTEEQARTSVRAARFACDWIEMCRKALP